MIEHLKIDRKGFLSTCKSLEAAMKTRPGTHWVTLRFEPGLLRMESGWGGGIVVTDGKEVAVGKIAYAFIKKLIRTQGLTKLKKDSLSCILAPGIGKLVIENGALLLTFAQK